MMRGTPLPVVGDRHQVHAASSVDGPFVTDRRRRVWEQAQRGDTCDWCQRVPWDDKPLRDVPGVRMPGTPRGMRTCARCAPKVNRTLVTR